MSLLFGRSWCGLLLEVCVQRIQNAAYFLQQGVVIGQTLGCPFENCFKARRFRHRCAAHIERVNHGCQPLKSAVGL